MEKQAIIHVENTEGIVEFAKFLTDAGWTILSANKTEELLKKEKIPVTKEQALIDNNLFIADTSALIQRILTSSFCENNNTALQQDAEIGIVCVNVSPALHSINTEQKLKSIARPYNFFLSTVLRNSFVNYENILILSDPEDYKEAIVQIRNDNITSEFRTYLAAKALNLVSAFDGGIASSLLLHSIEKNEFMRYLTYPFEKQMVLHHGSNKQQNSCLYKFPNGTGAINDLQKQQGKQLSYNTLSDISFAWEQISMLSTNLKNQFAVKSTNCDGYNYETQFTSLTGTVFTIAVRYKSILGASLSTNVLDSFRNTYTYDKENIPKVTFACSAVIDEEAASEIVKCNFAAIVAPGFTQEAKKIFSSDSNLILIQLAKISTTDYDLELINGGLLFQTKDNVLFDHWNIKTKNRPSQYLTDEMALGMILAMGSRSYSSVLLKNNAVIGISQACKSPNRSVDVALLEAKLFASNNPEKENDDNKIADLLVCDSAVSLCDSIKELIDKGLSAIIQTGGKPGDDDFIAYCNEHSVTMIFTNTSHISY